MLARVILLSLIVSTVYTQATEAVIFQKYQQYLSQFQKQYGSLDEMAVRYDVFKNNYLSALESQTETSEVQVTKFMGMTPNEFSRRYLTLNVDHFKMIKASTSGTISLKSGKEFQASRSTKAFNAWGASNGESTPDSWDWRAQGAVTKIRDQGNCGGCWSFSSVTGLEGAYFIKYGKLLTLSQQHLLDCDSGNGGCGGGAMEDAYSWLKTNGGVVQYQAYPYTGVVGTCKNTSLSAKVQVSSWKVAGTTNEEDIKTMLYQYGPLAVAINATPLQNYSGGIIKYTTAQCDPNGTNHAVNIVGYGTENGTPYWIIKNSWGSDWGENGYMRVLRGKGTCGINTYVVAPRVA